MKFPILQLRRLNTNFNKKTVSIYSPIDNKKIGDVCCNDIDEISQIIDDSKNAFNDWKITPFFAKKELILNFREKIAKNQEILANLITKEIAKSKKEAELEVQRSIEYIDLTIREFELLNLDNVNFSSQDVKLITKMKHHFFYEPLGLVLIISPFNYPLNLLITKIIPALITGNTVIYKPAQQGSLVGAKISELLFEAGLSNGEIACVIGSGKEIGDFLVTNPNFAMINFTGSSKVGQMILRKRTGIPIILEMGGKDPAIVLADADLDLAAQEIVKGAFTYNGQRCTAIKRILANEEIYDELVRKINNLILKLKVGSASIDGNDITELISENAIQHNMELLNNAISLGAIPQQPIVVNKNILSPILLTNVNEKMQIAWEENFGPILPMLKVKDINEAIKLANQSEYGLQASIFTKNYSLAQKIANELECGRININKATGRGPDIFPFTGFKNSGFGVQGVKSAILSFLRIKGIVYNEEEN